MQDLQTNDPVEFGPDNAPVTLVVFSDFQCPYCARFAQSIDSIRTSPRHDVKIIFHQFPLPIHPNAKKEAALAVCTAEQSAPAFWELHDYLFAHQKAAGNRDPSEAGLRFLADRHDINARKLSACMVSPETDSKISRDIALGTKYGVSGTPTSFLNGQRVVGAQEIGSLNAMIEGRVRPTTRLTRC
jgi:protein-disulfide isomerase